MRSGLIPSRAPRYACAASIRSKAAPSRRWQSRRVRKTQIPAGPAPSKSAGANAAMPASARRPEMRRMSSRKPAMSWIASMAGHPPAGGSPSGSATKARIGLPSASEIVSVVALDMERPSSSVWVGYPRHDRLGGVAGSAEVGEHGAVDVRLLHDKELDEAAAIWHESRKSVHTAMGFRIRAQRDGPDESTGLSGNHRPPATRSGAHFSKNRWWEFSRSATRRSIACTSYPAGNARASAPPC